MTKLKAALIHLSLSVFVISLLIGLIFFIWYPQPFFDISGVDMPLKLLVMIDVIVGPLLTFIVYKKHKKSLKFDLSVIVLLQLCALGFGVYTIYQGRPTLIVMNNGSFNYLVEKFSNNDELKFDELKPHIFSKPKYAFLTQKNHLDIYNDYADFTPIKDYKREVLPHSISVKSMLAQFSKKQDEIKHLDELYKEDSIVFYVLVNDQTNYYVVYSTVRNKIIDYLKF